MPALQQEIGVQFPLLAPHLVELIGMPLAGADSLKNLALLQCLPILTRRLLAERFAAANFVLKLKTQLLQLLANQDRKVKLRGHASGGKRA